MALRNRSQLPDSLFFALSPQGQRVANTAAQPAPAPKGPRPLTVAQRRILRTLDDRATGGMDFSDLRAVEILAERGLALHTGTGYLMNTAHYRITEAGRAQVQTDLDAGNVVSPDAPPPAPKAQSRPR